MIFLLGSRYSKLTEMLSHGATMFTTGAGGEVTINTDGSFNYTPIAGLAGPSADSFTYKATNGSATVHSMVTISIEG